VEKRNLIIGGATNYGINQLKPWVLSAKEVADDNTDIVLVCANMTPETYSWLVGEGVILVEMKQIPNIPVHVLRFLSIYDFLHQKGCGYKYVVTTDVKDVYFQDDPFKFLTGRKLVVASEGLLYKDEPWGNQNLYEAYGKYVYEKFKANEICNVGTFGGEMKYVKDMVFHIFTNGVNRPIPIVDQAVFNVLINTHPFKEVVTETEQWAAELGTIMDPSKIEQFRPHLLVDEPTFKNGVLTDDSGHVYPIIHQYDRVPEIKKFVQEKYGQEDESQYFIYRT
jgi:hypothetical protein